MNLKKILTELGQKVADELAGYFQSHKIQVIAGFPNVEVTLTQEVDGYFSNFSLGINLITKDFEIHTISGKDNTPVTMSISSGVIAHIINVVSKVFEDESDEPHEPHDNQKDDFSRTD